MIKKMLLLLPTSVYNIITTLLQSPKKIKNEKLKKKPYVAAAKKVVLKKIVGKIMIELNQVVQMSERYG